MEASFVIVLALAWWLCSATTAQDCFPNNSGFQAAGCTCTRDLCAEGIDERAIVCESHKNLLKELPVLAADKNYTKVVCL